MALASASAGDFAVVNHYEEASNMISPIMDEIGASVGFVFGGSGLCKLQFFIDDLAIIKDIRSPNRTRPK